MLASPAPLFADVNKFQLILRCRFSGRRRQFSPYATATGFQYASGLREAGFYYFVANILQ